MSTTASDVLVETLMDWGVEVVFGIPGDGVNGVIEALRQRQDKVRFVQVRHEEAAAFMACAYAKWTGKLGVCIATSGPGGVHLLNGLYDAKLDGQPVLAITGMQFHDLISTFTQQDVELDKLFMDACAYSVRAMGAAHVENIVELACRTALARRQPTHVCLPVDIQVQPLKADKRSARNIPSHVSQSPAWSPPAPPEAEIARAAAVLNAGEKVCILAGAGALGASEALAAVAERLAAPVGKALLGKAALADDHPHATGGVGLLGTRASQEAMEGCDTLLIVGSSFPYIEFYPKPGKARGVQIDRDPQRIGLRFPAEVGLVADAGEVLRALLPRLEPKTDRTFLEEIQAKARDWKETLAERAAAADSPMKADVLAHALDGFLEPNAIVTTDCGLNTGYAARHLTMRAGMMFSTSGTLASMGAGLPYAIAAKIAYPKRQVVAFVGDGGLTMLMGELATVAKYGLDIKIVVMKNNSLGQIKWEQMAFLGNPEYVCDLQPIDFAMVARGFGLAGYSVADPKDCARVLGEAFATPGPAVIEAMVDPDEPMLPPKTTKEQALHMAKALMRGTPGGDRILREIVGDVRREMI